MIRALSSTFAVIGLALAASGPVSAQAEPPPIYEVEVIVFTYTGREAGREELWPARLLVPRLDGALELLPPLQSEAAGAGRDSRRPAADRGSRLAAAAPGVATDATVGLANPAEQFEILPPSAYRLREEAERIQGSSRYRVLWHNAWRQPGLGPDLAVAVRVRAGEPLELPLVDLTARLDLETLMRNLTVLELPGPLGESPLLGSMTGVQLPAALLVPPDSSLIRIYPLDGSLRLEMGRYLHLYTDLILTEPVAILADARQRGRRLDQQPVEALQSYPMRSHRRMRSGELHHLDHPMLGLLVLTTRHEVEPAALPEAAVGDAEPVEPPAEPAAR